MINTALIERYNIPVPRYTSYPPATLWEPMDGEAFRRTLSQRDPLAPLSLYLHIPFCSSLCLYCGCSTIPNTDRKVEERYVKALLQEISLLRNTIGQARVNQIHFGGGTPTKLRASDLTALLATLRKSFSLDPHAEIAFEVDPRSVDGENKEILHTLKELGVNRLSLGIQDFNWTVQNAIGRRQKEEVSTQVFFTCQDLGFESINFDLVYGLPCQTTFSFQKTIDQVVALRPHRIALFSFAYLPELKPHQKAISPTSLPSPEEKFRIYLTARTRLIESGYRAIGLDHFALPDDPLSISLENGHLRRTFQGYTVLEGNEVIGLGMTGISDLQIGFFQHAKILPEYEAYLKKGEFPTAKGLFLSTDDLLRRFVIEKIMCLGKIEKTDVDNRYKVSFDDYFHEAKERLQPLIDDGLVIDTPLSLLVTPQGQLFLRNVASCFDAHLSKTTLASRAI